MPGIDDRVTRLEARMDAHGTKLSEVAEKVQWIKGYLQTHGNGGDVSPRAHMPRDAAMIIGGGGGTGTLLLLFERFFGG